MMIADRTPGARLTLLWIERGCLASGVALATLCVATWLEARFVQRLPIPPPTPAESIAERAGERPAGRSSERTALTPGTWLAKIDAPSVQLSATVLEGTDDGTLSRGAGHIEDTAFPGDSGNIGIAGHRDTTFRAVRHLRIGDPLVLTTADLELRYRVRALTIVDPEDVDVLEPTGHPTLTLVTCYPFAFIGHAPKRFIVSADLVVADRRKH